MGKMLQAKVTKAFPGLPDEETLVREIKVGEIITGSLAEVALREKWAEEVKSSDDVKPADETKPPKEADEKAAKDKKKS